MPYPRGGRHELIEVEHEAGPVATVWPEDDEEEDVVPELDVVEDSEVWIAAWREFDEDTPTMRAVLAEHNAPADRAEEAA
ncbi:hypothetical protein ABZ215_25030 [Amycolatopsis sp. NPDC006131]|uniref:hypothetical protein n=1 Tax=Amycolatopsis sp. NPDC006131 TaxID=3156731 RepID=UPI0033AE5754